MNQYFRINLFFIKFILIACFLVSCDGFSQEKTTAQLDANEIAELYKSAGLNGKISYAAFKYAYIGNVKTGIRKNIMVVIDFSLPSDRKRLTVIDLNKKEMLVYTYVAHGKNSGGLYATAFSNDNGSNKSSLGFYKTGKTYSGKHGYSLRLHGLEKGINDNAYRRAIVIHSADYVSEHFIKQNKRLGRSLGCPALPKELSTKIIGLIKDGTCVFIYAKDEAYFKRSKYIEA